MGTPEKPSEEPSEARSRPARPSEGDEDLTAAIAGAAADKQWTVVAALTHQLGRRREERERDLAKRVDKLAQSLDAAWRDNDEIREALNGGELSERLRARLAERVVARLNAPEGSEGTKVVRLDERRRKRPPR